MAKMLQRAAAEFARRPVSNTFMALGGILLSRSLSHYLDRLESDRRNKDMQKYYPAPIDEVVSLGEDPSDVPTPAPLDENIHA